MDRADYYAMYERIAKSNLAEISKEFGVHEKVLRVILNQKIVRDVKRRYPAVKSNSQELAKLWFDGKPICAIARDLDIPPVLIASPILALMGYSAASKRKALSNPESIKDRRLRSEVLEALEEDDIYSPRAHKMQHDRGRLGERIIADWLRNNALEFAAEEAIPRGEKIKIPDFLLKKPITVGGKEVTWIESKASFGDAELHSYYLEKQFIKCLERYGGGFVVYWYGFLDSIPKTDERLVVKDYRFFADKMGEDYLRENLYHWIR